MKDVNLQADMLQAMRRLAKSVTIISTSNGAERFAMAATAVDSLSTEPPSLLICINKSASSHAALATGAGFCVNILGLEQQALAHLCSGAIKGEARFSSGNWLTSDEGIPYLGDAQSAILCRQDGHFSYGTHTVFIGRIVRIHTSPSITPLVYLDGRYTTTAQPAQTQACAG
ncbi:flavin reductase (DIM6/NTAB) family NADH-FMN oxidoreductase RutF [Pseudomonas protegens]|uniref:flavin reductase family protein n=1 Tax=Pseudomonas TaxID=286 RepID=UPI000884F3C6|nr:MULTISPECIES: flavin reductase family protein [Pseudomonas]MCU1765978.1 flavin reductase family protein [Pseudomonas protegens]URN86597.1 MAG: flavin reductase family protein [Pseudomonas protegens]WEK24681.1 MAG: flavin reductase family protein [Pseudomonas protegens]SDA34860.1 NADH-FMN oxidoreductase RutF, flavin reductase (DIM6/NTAB) family [Pseudomonas sp. NFPP12]SEM67700.1 NADH-FMN oxidoreductase RutF, flavin reductase (DIM6/NTAB) family [Pseudomonas sp. NFPP10]